VSFPDDIGAFFAAHGIPFVAGRILGHLLVSEAPEQSFEDLCREVGASRASVSTMTRLLIQLGLIERRPGRGRTLVYRVRDDAWTQLLEDDLASAIRLRELASQGLRQLAGRPTASRRRLTEMRDFYAFLETRTRSVVDAWNKRRKR